MRALVIDKDGSLRLREDFPKPKPGPGEVLLKPRVMGVCSTDLELAKGYMGFQGVLGHEFVADVIEAADDAGQPWLGKRVVGEINAVCGACDLCLKGLREHCRQRTVLGILGRDGAFAEAFTLPAANLHEVPDHVSDDEAVFTEPLAAAFQIVRQLTIEGRPYVTVLGDGRLGLLCAQVLGQLNATVRVVGKHAEKLERAEKWNIKHRLLADVGMRRDQDIVIDATGSPTGLPTALGMVRPRGSIVLKTTVAERAYEKPIDLSPIVIDEITVMGSRCGPFAVALEALARNDVDVLSMISRRGQLAAGPELLATASQRDVIKVLVTP
ncbi:MDR/zinc-dependent alcohol dehydrogenase-like family protein [Mucisphaera calidilacus]|uniref:2-deoxy-scyllo-inosamine dehydrogenase n=1 Tax=Mucisphaera calidilacus TaxID=2527982 RepID=A0A518BY61_9BACT|nr:alcohol dehydrogenase catalytic domain-containing protein [Mucisphaera calidilacus]QDU71915.1 2-deoxy-scyllo-inosamine dehydrogenase [Mucisphaera calidilacus]